MQLYPIEADGGLPKEFPPEHRHYTASGKIDLNEWRSSDSRGEFLGVKRKGKLLISELIIESLDVPLRLKFEGPFRTPDQAALAYAKAYLAHHGQLHPGRGTPGEDSHSQHCTTVPCVTPRLRASAPARKQAATQASPTPAKASKRNHNAKPTEDSETEDEEDDLEVPLHVWLDTKSELGLLGVRRSPGGDEYEAEVFQKRSYLRQGFPTPEAAAAAYAHLRLKLRPKVTSSEEILHLVTSGKNPTGWKGVRETQNGRFKAEVTVEGDNRYLGTFDTLAEAAIAYAVGLNTPASEDESDEEAEEKAGSAPLEPLRRVWISETNPSGFAGVSKVPSSGQFEAIFELKALGKFDTAEAAAVAYSRERQQIVLTVQKGEKMLELVTSKNSATGYRGVCMKGLSCQCTLVDSNNDGSKEMK